MGEFQIPRLVYATDESGSRFVDFLGAFADQISSFDRPFFLPNQELFQSGFPSRDRKRQSRERQSIC